MSRWSEGAGREAACLHDGKKYAEVRAPQQSALNRCNKIFLTSAIYVKLFVVVLRAVIHVMNEYIGGTSARACMRVS